MKPLINKNGVHVATAIALLSNGLYNIIIDDKLELAALYDGLLYTIDGENIVENKTYCMGKSDLSIQCKGNLVPLWKTINIISIKPIGSDCELCVNPGFNAHWEDLDDGWTYECSNCGYYIRAESDTLPNVCPTCGCVMKEE